MAKLLHETERMLVPLTDRLGLSPESRIRLGLGTASVLEEFLGPEG
ncbi:MAG: hypothetical protein ACXV3F_00445 [Frankiaceae bacterium]